MNLAVQLAAISSGYLTKESGGKFNWDLLGLVIDRKAEEGGSDEATLEEIEAYENRFGRN